MDHNIISFIVNSCISEVPIITKLVCKEWNKLTTSKVTNITRLWEKENTRKWLLETYKLDELKEMMAKYDLPVLFHTCFDRNDKKLRCDVLTHDSPRVFKELYKCSCVDVCIFNHLPIKCLGIYFDTISSERLKEEIKQKKPIGGGHSVDKIHGLSIINEYEQGVKVLTDHMSVEDIALCAIVSTSLLRVIIPLIKGRFKMDELFKTRGHIGCSFQGSYMEVIEKRNIESFNVIQEHVKILNKSTSAVANKSSE